MKQHSNNKITRALVLEDMTEANEWMTSMLLLTFPDIQVDQAKDLNQARRLLQTQPYDLALIDLSLPDGKGIEIIDWLSHFSKQTISIVVTIFDDDENLLEAICHGAKGYLLKDLEPQMFQLYLQQQVLGIPAFSTQMTHKILQYIKNNEATTKKTAPQSHALPLTPREKQIFIYIAKGLQAPEIATQLGLSSYTVSSYIKEIYRKLKISSRVQAALLAQHYGLSD